MKGIPESFAFTTILSNSEVTSSVSQGVDELRLSLVATQNTLFRYNASGLVLLPINGRI